MKNCDMCMYFKFVIAIKQRCTICQDVTQMECSRYATRFDLRVIEHKEMGICKTSYGIKKCDKSKCDNCPLCK